MHKVNRFPSSVHISVIGCGGTGSHVVNQLVDVHTAITTLGHPGLTVQAYDGDAVAFSNVGRQAFYQQDVGRPKAQVLIERINMYYGLNWRAHNHLANGVGVSADILISCVDTKASRRLIKGAPKTKKTYIIECGNARASGQVILGQEKGDLPNPYREHPGLTKGKEPKGEGCLDPYYKQDLAVNRVVATYVQQIVWDLLRKHEIGYRGVFFDLTKFTSNGIQVNRKEGA